MGSLSQTNPLRVAIVKAYEIDEPKHRGMLQSFRDNVLQQAPDAIIDAYRPMKEDGHLPNPENYDLIIITGGLSNLCQATFEPWVITTLEWIRQVVSQQHITKTKLLGICWGHQAIASALCGSIGSFEHPRVGVQHLMLNDDGKEMFGKDTLKITKFHKRFVQQVPDGFKPLAPDNEILFSDSGLILSFQGHPEIYGELSRQLFEMNELYYRATLPTEEDLQRYYSEMSSSEEDAKLIFRKVTDWALS
ncbi:copper iron-regulated glutamine amidotransferase [Colletotrichum incanum]|uniref:Copper iron-regulated glutamine amidotransferase n=1 Tax=Colletotrichum incanum TaxID=1573173 RepID=A0A166QDA3_COLIC|nr:copper iron-regulated glutamine amidotransferase [Colletotrichum incanum]OHW89647.1 copper iron-regulated glutamine amidotransferase [Colletotrichum incanum]